MTRKNGWLAVAGALGATATAAGAWAAHGLSDNPAAQIWAETASRYQMIHAAVIVALATADMNNAWTSRSFMVARWLFLWGVALFCGSLYALATVGRALFPGSAPLGGLALIAGWLAIAAGAFGRIKQNAD